MSITLTLNGVEYEGPCISLSLGFARLKSVSSV
jgi:hypothetical protein